MEEINYIKQIFKLINDFKNEKTPKEDLIALIESGKIGFPKYLYKYRECLEYNFLTLANRQCYFNLPSCWKDSIDSTVCFDLEKDAKKLQNSQTAVPKTAYLIIKKYLDSRQLSSVLTFDDFNRIYKTIYPQGIDFSQEYSFSHFSRRVMGVNEIHKAVNKAFGSLLKTNDIRNRYLMLSLTKTYKNNMMWNEYAKDDSGFCIKYDIGKLLKNDPSLILNLLPIYYGNKKPVSFLEYIGAAFDNKNADKISLKISQQLYISMLTKNIEWSGEQEWRIICDDNNINDNLRNFDCAVAIYLGSNISKAHRENLVDIAKALKLKVYQRKLNILKNDYVYELCNF